YGVEGFFGGVPVQFAGASPTEQVDNDEAVTGGRHPSQKLTVAAAPMLDPLFGACHALERIGEGRTAIVAVWSHWMSTPPRPCGCSRTTPTRCCGARSPFHMTRRS